MVRLFLFTIFFFLLSASLPATGQIYRYIDKEGGVRFTDDLTRVPEGQRPAEYSESSTPSDAPAPAPAPEGGPQAGRRPEKAPLENGAKEKEELKTRGELKSEHDALMKEKERIERESEQFSKRLKTRKRKELSRTKLKELDAQKAEWNKKFSEYEEKRKALEKRGEANR